MKKLTSLFLAVVLCLSLCACGKTNSTTGTTAKDDVVLAPMRVHGKWGYINLKGEMVVEPQFDYAGIFSEGLALVESDDKYCYIDKTGKVLFDFPENQYDCENIFSEGLASVAKTEPNEYGYTDYTYGYIDATGNFVIEPQFNSATDFSEGLAGAVILDENNNIVKKGFIDKTGKFVIDFSELQIRFATEFSDGLAAVDVNYEYGFIDKNGNFVIEPQFENADIFSEGLAPVKIDGKWGYIDKSGNFVINPQFDYVHEFSDGLAVVKVDNKWGYIDKTGDYVIEPNFKNAWNFVQGVAFVYENGKLGVIDKTGDFVFEPIFNYREGPYGFFFEEDGYANVTLETGETAVILTDGTIYLSSDYE